MRSVVVCLLFGVAACAANIGDAGTDDVGVDAESLRVQTFRDNHTNWTPATSMPDSEELLMCWVASQSSSCNCLHWNSSRDTSSCSCDSGCNYNAQYQSNTSNRRYMLWTTGACSAATWYARSWELSSSANTWNFGSAPGVITSDSVYYGQCFLRNGSVEMNRQFQ